MILLDVGHFVQILAEHLGDQLHPGQILNDVLAHQLAVPQHGDPVADLIDLLEEVGDEDDAHALLLEVKHELEELLHLLLVERGGGLVENEHLALHVHRPGDGHHLLHGDGAAAQLLGGAGGNVQRFENLSGAAVHGAPVDTRALGTGDEHILRHGEVGAEGDLLVHRADACVLGILGRTDAHGSLLALEEDLPVVLFIDAGQNLDQRGFAGAVFSHQRVDLALAEGEIHILKGSHAGEILADAAHFQYCAFLHTRFASI